MQLPVRQQTASLPARGSQLSSSMSSPPPAGSWGRAAHGAARCALPSMAKFEAPSSSESVVALARRRRPRGFAFRMHGVRV